MELKLYQHIRKNFLKETIDLFDKSTQEKIEAFDASIGLDEKILDAVKKYLKAYNTYLEAHKQNKVTLRYYQILAIYFTEVFFRHRDSKGFEDFAKSALAYWMATGSGKTMIMHINVFQFIEHNRGFKDLEIIITTPGVNLIHQHEREVTPLVEYLNKIHRNKIRFTIDTTSALLNKADDFFDFPDNKKYQRLILVDEAHIGLGTNQKEDEGEFLKLRKKLNIKHSFLFEYSATFHNLDSKLEKEYSKSIIYDYNYNLFYRDGYGKDFYFQKVNADVLRNNNPDDNLKMNLSVIEDKLSIFNNLDYSTVRSLFSASTFPDKPLIAFMGNTVNDRSKEGKGEDELSDISKIVEYLARLPLEDRAQYRNLFNNEINGNLKLTRNPQADDEILLSYGNGDYWGIVNVGNGLKFINDFQVENVAKVTGTSIVISNIDRYTFQDIDSPNSRINMLIGSRKFAEGWNCFRVSVIGLINLGKSKGNKIIQIFGRGVRLKGLNNDGKRFDQKHIDDYFALGISEDDNLKKLETLCVFSLQRSYLETFTEAVTSELEIVKSIEIPVSPSILIMNNDQVSFDRYRNDLKIFKLSKRLIDVKEVIVYPKERRIEYKYKYGGLVRKGSINTFSFNLDYRTDLEVEGVNIRNSLLRINKELEPFIDISEYTRSMNELSEEYNLRIYKAGKTLSALNISDVIEFTDDIMYKEEIPDYDFQFVENVNAKIAEEFVKKVRNRINWHLNSSNYSYDKLIEQSNGDIVGDFIERYTVSKSFKLLKVKGRKSVPKTETELNEEIETFGNSIINFQTQLSIDNMDKHIYQPLLAENQHILTDDLRLTPDKLNAGETKFVKDFSEFLIENPKLFSEYNVYLMRNVESLKSIGIYLDDDAEVYYPDFILWMVSDKSVYITFIDPKGQMGLKDFNTEQYREKVKISDKHANATLPNIEKELKKVHKKKFILNSFILLRDSSDLGRRKDIEWKMSNMIDNNIFRLDWHLFDEKEQLADENELVEGKSYLDWMMEKILIN